MSLSRPNGPVPTHPNATAHQHRSPHATSAVAPPVVDPDRARIKALSELKESQDQVARMKAQGIGEPATEK